MKFVENRFIAQLEINKQLNAFASSQKKTWEMKVISLKPV